MDKPFPASIPPSTGMSHPPARDLRRPPVRLSNVLQDVRHQTNMSWPVVVEPIYLANVSLIYIRSAGQPGRLPLIPPAIPHVDDGDDDDGVLTPRNPHPTSSHSMAHANVNLSLLHVFIYIYIYLSVCSSLPASAVAPIQDRP